MIDMKSVDEEWGPVVHVWIDGVLLTDLDVCAPLPLADAVQLAAGWTGRPFRAPHHYVDAGTAVPIATCSCGDYACGGLSVRVVNEPRHVVWTVCSSWGEPNGTTWRFERGRLGSAITRATGVQFD